MTSTRSLPASVAALAATLGLAAVCWAVVVRRMGGMDMGVMAPRGPFAPFLVMWIVMMAAMMLPGLAPTLWRHARAGGRAHDVLLFVASYLAVWALFGLPVYAVYRPHGTLIAGLITIAAGLYELTPLKRAFRARCCRDRYSGLTFGLCCIGSSIGLMLMQVSLGIMSIGWMVVASILIVGQKLLPAEGVDRRAGRPGNLCARRADRRRAVVGARAHAGNAPRLAPPRRGDAEFFRAHRKSFLIVKPFGPTYRAAQIRTCLWSHDVRGRTAGKDPGRFEGRGLKQRRSGLFWSLPAFHQPGLLKRHLLIAGRADRASPAPSEGSERPDSPVRSSRLPPANQPDNPANRDACLRIDRLHIDRPVAGRPAVSQHDLAWGEPENDRPYPRLPAPPTTRRPLPRRRPRYRPRQLPRLRHRHAGQPRLLRGQGQPGAGDPRTARRPRLQLRLRQPRRDRHGACRRRNARAHLLRQHHQEGARHRRRL